MEAAAGRLRRPPPAIDSHRGSFQSLLQALAREHVREVQESVASLQVENETLRKQVQALASFRKPTVGFLGAPHTPVGAPLKLPDLPGMPNDEPGKPSGHAANEQDLAEEHGNQVERFRDDESVVTEAAEDIPSIYISNAEEPPQASKASGPYRLRPLWESRGELMMGGLRTSTLGKTTMRLDESAAWATVVPSGKGLCAGWVRSPGSPWGVAWDLFGGILILYDLIVVPLLAFSPPETPFTVAMDWFCLLFWSCNMVNSFFIGIIRNGEVINDPKEIAKQYLKFWFWIDLASVGPDWAKHALSSTAVEFLRLVRVFRLARFFRILRILRLAQILTIINDLFDSEVVSIIADVFKMIVLLLGVNHGIACAWFAVGSSPPRGYEETWIIQEGFDDEPWTSQYLVSFHWSITQFTPSSMKVQPYNPRERAFAIWIVVFALVGFSSLVGSITGSLTQLRGIKEEEAKEFWKLRRYLKRNRIPSELAVRVRRYLECEYRRQVQGATPNKVKLLVLLSQQLHSELQCAIYVPILKVHPLFTHLDEVSKVTVQRFATGCIVERHFARADIVFHATEVATACYFVVSGRLLYKRIDLAQFEHSEWVDKGEDWIAEPVLWTPSWAHLGALIACQMHNQLLLVEATEFGEIVRLTPRSLYIVQSYAHTYMDHLNSTPEKDLSDISQGDQISDRIWSFIEREG